MISCWENKQECVDATDQTFSRVNLDPFQLVDKNCRVLGVNVLGRTTEQFELHVVSHKLRIIKL